MKKIICFGDSNTYGYDPSTGGRFDENTRWPKRLQKLLGDDYEIFEEGQNGRTIANADPWEGGTKCGMDYVLPMLETKHPVDLLIIMLGTNDLKVKFNLPAADIAGSLQMMLSKIKAFCRDYINCPDMKILVVSPLSLSEPFSESYFEPFFCGAVAVEKVKELAKSISIELGEEITSPRFDDIDALKELVEKLSNETDFVIVCMNWGDKNSPKPNKKMIKCAKKLAHYGANLIIGYHPSITFPVSYIKADNGKRALVFWSLGHLVLDLPKKYSYLGAMANITISKSENEAYISEYNLIPTINHKGDGNNYFIYKLTQYSEALFKQSYTGKNNLTRADVVKKCEKVMGGFADCY